MPHGLIKILGGKQGNARPQGLLVEVAGRPGEEGTMVIVVLARRFPVLARLVGDLIDHAISDDIELRPSEVMAFSQALLDCFIACGYSDCTEPVRDAVQDMAWRTDERKLVTATTAWLCAHPGMHARQSKELREVYGILREFDSLHYRNKLAQVAQLAWIAACTDARALLAVPSCRAQR